MTRAIGRPAVDAGFHLDDDALRSWLTAKRDELELDNDPEALKFADLGEEALHHDLERYIHELVEAGALVEPLGWNVGVYALDEDDEWGYLVTVRTSNERRHPGGVGFFQVADTYDDLRPSTAVADEVGSVVRTANRLLPIARAAWIGTDPTAVHHPDGMCKAHGDYDCGEDECQASTADGPCTPDCDGAAELIRIVFTTDDVLSMADEAGVPADVAVDRSCRWAGAITDTATSLCNEQLASVVAHDAP